MQSPLGLYFSFLKKYRRMSVPIVLSVILETAFTAGIPYSFSIIVDRALLGNDRRLLLYIVGGLMVGVLIVALLGIARDRLYARLTAGVMNDIRTEMFTHLQRLSIAFYGRNQVGNILARFSSDLSGVEHASWGAIK